MGLDSVELVVNVEQYFNINIPNREAEKISTVQDMTDVVLRHLNVHSTEMRLRDDVFNRIALCIRQVDPSVPTLQLSDCIARYLPAGNRPEWKAFEDSLGLQLPEPDLFQPSGHVLKDGISKLYHKAFPAHYDWEAITMSQFVDAVCACNCSRLIDPARITTQYEVYIAVVFLTVEKTGADYYEVSPEKSFTRDLGVD